MKHRLTLLLLTIAAVAQADVTLSTGGPGPLDAARAVVKDGKVNVESDFAKINVTPLPSDFGFTYKKGKDGLGSCRFRFKLSCDYGLEVVGPIKHTDVQLKLQAETKVYNARTEQDGIVDAKFFCKKPAADGELSIKIPSYQTTQTLKDFPQEIRVPSQQCK